MKTIKLEYQNRLNEIDELLKFLKLIETTNLYNNINVKVYTKNNVIINSIKSSLILIIYNLIEFTIINSIESIELDFKSYDIKKFKEEFQTLFYKTFGIFLNELKFENILSIINENDKNLEKIIDYGYFNENLKLSEKCKIKVSNQQKQSLGIKGNINYKTICTLSKLFDFKLNKTKHINNGNSDLLHEIKGKRNSLSHGHDSFNNLGQSLSLSQLLNYRKNVSDFLNGYLIIIEKYINDKPYLKT